MVKQVTGLSNTPFWSNSDLLGPAQVAQVIWFMFYQYSYGHTPFQDNFWFIQVLSLLAFIYEEKEPRKIERYFLI